jgi:acyl-CoA dehydrogenase
VTVSIEFTVPDEVADLAARTATLVREVVIPVEIRVRGALHDGDESVRAKVQQAAREAGVFCQQMPPEYGGLGLDMRGQAVVFEQAGYSLLGPLATNCAAPDEGNMHLLEVVGSPVLRERYLKPLAAGDTRSCFAMTEPAPGAGADPRALATTATRVAGGWRIDGRKWFISGARGAAFAIVMARTSGVAGDAGGATMFLVDAGTPGFKLVRDIDTMDQGLFAGHSEIVFDECVVPDDQVLGEVDRGFEYAQVRLAPARLTHCMRWLGIARRAQDIALGYATTRKAFGGYLADLGMVQQQIADSEIDIEASRAMIYRSAWQLDQSATDSGAGHLSSMTKVFVAEAAYRVVDRSVQICGALGISEDVLLSRYFREVRAFRVYDGPSDTHRWAIAKRVSRRHRTVEA